MPIATNSRGNFAGIARYLTKSKILTPGGKEKWSTSTVKSILTNEKYKGDALLQKSYTVDFLTKKKKKNDGEVPQYYMKNSHPAIISPEVFDMVQDEFEKRKSHAENGTTLFSSKIICGECGNFYGSKVWHSNSKYRHIVWRCNAKYKNMEKCKTPHVTEEQIREGFVKAVNILIENKKSVIEDCENTTLKLTSTDLIEEKEAEIQIEQKMLYNSLKELINQNSHLEMNQNEYDTKYEGLRIKYEKTSEKLSEIEKLKFEIRTKKYKIEKFIKNLKSSSKLIKEFDERLWYALIERVIINADGSIKFEFKNGQTIE